MLFTRPVDDRFPISAQFLEWGDRWWYFMDPLTGYWIPRGSSPGEKGQHRGVDFLCPKGTVVTAMCDGIITRARYESVIRTDSGDGLNIVQLVTMKGYDAWWVKYSHLKISYVDIGMHVSRGQPLGETGCSGNVPHPLLHVDLQDPRHQFHPIPWIR